MDALTSDIQEEAPWCMLFADDIVLVGEEGPEIQRRLAKWKERLENVGLKICRTKTKHMFCDFGGSSDFTQIALDGVSLPVCSDFKYLGSILQNDGNIDRDVANRINAAISVSMNKLCSGGDRCEGKKEMITDHLEIHI
ncbi:uncharacterized protein LOC119628531 [Bombyx mori]|uniref:Reverse transcriptase domain-containing protein n=1 Tax=Bombyx mori TaxID=7091 RepID=A0A8R2LVC4_BOMMO|nr:uncharacterized protein LOC119628531 [Bombyx mori]